MERFQDMLYQIDHGLNSVMMQTHGTTVQPMLDTYYMKLSRRVQCDDLERICEEGRTCSRNASRTGLHCVLSESYNFFVDYKNVRSEIVEHVDSSNDTAEANMINAIRRTNWSLPDIKVIHWPGEFRKPWEKQSPLARSTFDQKWWDVYSQMCASWYNCSMSC